MPATTDQIMSSGMVILPSQTLHFCIAKSRILVLTDWMFSAADQANGYRAQRISAAAPKPWLIKRTIYNCLSKSKENNSSAERKTTENVLQA